MIITEIINIIPFKVGIRTLQNWCKNKNIPKVKVDGLLTYNLTYTEILLFCNEKLDDNPSDFIYDQEKYDTIKSQAFEESLDNMDDETLVNYETAKLKFKAMSHGELKRIKGVDAKSKAWLQLEQAKAKEIDNNIKIQQYVPADIFKIFMQCWANFFEKQAQDLPKKVIMQHKINPNTTNQEWERIIGKELESQHQMLAKEKQQLMDQYFKELEQKDELTAERNK